MTIYKFKNNNKMIKTTLKTVILSVALTVCTFAMQAQVYKTVDVEANDWEGETIGALYQALTAEELQTVTHLTITGTINVKDFWAIRDYMHQIISIDISRVTIVGCLVYGMSYPANVVSHLSSLAALQSIDLPESVTTIGGEAFSGCTALQSINLPTSLITIGDYAFADAGITSIELPASPSKIGGGAFAGTGITAFSVDEANVEYSAFDGILYNKNKTSLKLYPPAKEGAEFIVPENGNSHWRLLFFGLFTTHFYKIA